VEIYDFALIGAPLLKWDAKSVIPRVERKNITVEACQLHQFYKYLKRKGVNLGKMRK